MINKIYTLNKKLLSVSLLMTLSLYAGTYDEKYLPLQESNRSLEANDNSLMNGEFKEIVRFKMLTCKGTKEEESQKTLDTIIHTIKAYQADSKKIVVNIIGHTNATRDDANEKTIDSDTYANHVQNWFRSSFDTDESKKLSKEYALDTQKALLNAGIDANIMQVEYRGGADLGFTDETQEGKDASNRVMVAIYVLESADVDSDKDGVFDQSDTCENTPINTRVNASGCPFDGDMDGVVDGNDECPQTPKGVHVDKKGCPFDSDKDGVIDNKDECLETPIGIKVDLKGCPLNKTLALQFETASDKILDNSRTIVEEFATFMKKNPAYNAQIIGHTDSAGNAQTNMDLSQRRAETTKAALVANGIEAKRISTSGRGELDPLQSNRMQEGRAVNRRIEVKLSY